MGAELVSLALAHWTHVSDRAFRVLMRMALTAMDKPAQGRPAAVYHGGRELLAMTLRSDKGTAETRYRSVKRALSELAEEGAIQHLQTGWAGQRAVYRLTLDRGRKGGLSGPPEGGLRGPPMGGRSVSKRGASETPPRNHEELQEELAEEEAVDLQTSPHPPRATAANVIPISSAASKRPPLKDRLDAIIARTEPS